MKAKQMMDKDFIYASKDDSVVDISIRMEEKKKFTVPILDDSMKLEGWITSLEVTKGLREGKKTISEIMCPVEDILTINANKPAKNAVKMPYLLKNLKIERPNQVWAIDITYGNTAQLQTG